MLSRFCKFISCDVETGGLIGKNKRAVFDVALTEIALVVVEEDLSISEQKSWLVKPYSDTAEYNKGAEEASGISKAMCQEQGQDILLVGKEVSEFMKRHKQGNRLPVMVGHNFDDFDSYFLQGLFEWCKLDLMKFVQDGTEDTLKWSRLCWRESVNYKLGMCCQQANITLQNAHRALTDAYSTALLWVYFLKNLRGEGVTTETKKKRFRDTFEL